MKIQLITQNMKPIALKTKTNSNPILRNNQADSFERKSNVAFKGSNVPNPFKEAILASIAKRGEEGMDILFVNTPATKFTLTVLRDVLKENFEAFWKISKGEVVLPSRKEAVKQLVEHHNNISNASAFWQKATSTGSYSEKSIRAACTIDMTADKTVTDIYGINGLAREENILFDFPISVEQWVETMHLDKHGAYSQK